MKGGENLKLLERAASWYLTRSAKRSKGNSKLFGSSILSGDISMGDDDILSSSDIYHYMSAISNMFACGRWVVEDENGVDQKEPATLKILNHPNGYLTGFEFRKLMANVYLLQGETFVIRDRQQLHIMKGVIPEITENAVKQFRYGEHILYSSEVAQIKNMGMSLNRGAGIIDLARETMEGVLNAEKALTDKYQRGGFLAYLLKLDSHLSPKNTMQNQMVEAIQGKLEELNDDGKTLIIPLSKGYSIEGFESPVDDEKILSYLNVYKPELAKFLGFDPDAYHQLLKSDLEKAALYLKAFVVDPFVQNVCEHLSRLLFSQDSNERISLVIDLKKYLTMSQKITNTSNLVRSMVYTPDDGRDDLGVERLNTKESTGLYASKDLISVEQLSALNDAKMENERNEDTG